MKNKIQFFLILTILSSCISFCYAQSNFYIDAAAGNDANPGTIGAPWQNVTKINSLTVSAGSTINLKAGSVWTGQQLKFNGSGTSGSPIIVNSYGSGAKPILHGNGLVGEAVVYLYNQQYIEINNLEITNDPAGPNDLNYFIGQYQFGPLSNPTGADRRGVMVAIDGYGTASHIYLKNLDIHHIKGQLGSGGTTVNGAIPKRTGGIYFSVLGITESTSDKSRFNDVLIDGCNVYYCENIGLAFDNEWNVYYPGGETSVIPADQAEYADWYNRRFSNVKVSNNILHHIGKNAMIIRCTDETGLVERNTCYETAKGTTGNTMFTARAKGTVFQYNEGYFNRAGTNTVEPGGFDGSMYDPDFGSVGIIFQYSYSHDNDQGLFWGCNTRSATNNTSGIPDPGDAGCTLRYCISQNDKGDLVYFNYPSAGNEIYNNVFYIKSGISPNIIHENNSSNHTYNYFNNIVYNLSSSAGYAYGSGTGVQTRNFSNNTFYYNHPAGEPTSVQDPAKSTANPYFVNAGSGGTGINTLDGYKLQKSSAALNSGKLISNNGGQDYYGNPVSATAVPDRGVYEGIGIKPTSPIDIFLDQFTGTDGTLSTSANPALPGTGYSSNVGLTGAPSASILTNALKISGSGSTAGLAYVTAADTNYLAPYNQIISSNADSVYWSLNMFTTRNGAGALSTAMTGSWGVAAVLACDKSDPTASGASGYGVFLLQGHNTNLIRFHLIYFTNGINNVANTGSTNQTIIDTTASISSASARYYSIKVSYDPLTNKWQLASRNDGITAFADPQSTATLYTFRPAVANTTTGTNVALKYFGYAFKYGTSAHSATIENYRVQIVPQLQTLTASPASLNFGTLLSGTNSASQLFNLSGTQLTGAPGNITITAPSTNFQVSNDNSTWGASTTISFSSATLAATPVYVRFTPQSAAAFTGNVVASGGGASSINIPVTGTGVNTSIIGDPIYNTNAIFTFIAGQSVTIPFTAYGIITPGNVFTAQLSNGSGSFASPVTIGSLTSSTSGALTITGTIPANAVAGTGYLVRVIASTPALTGTPNANNLTIIPVQSLPYAQNFSSLNAAVGTFTTYPAGWQAWKFNNSAIGTTAATDAPTIERSIKGGDASAISDSSYAYDFNGKIGFATTSVQNGLVLAINTTGYSNVGLSFDAMTMWNPMTTLDSVVAGLQLQYRIGGTGIFTLIPSYSLTEYKNITTAQTSGTTGQNIIAHLNVTLPAACNNQNIVEIRWVMHKISVVSGGSIKSSTCPAMAIDNVYVGLSTQTITSSNFVQGDAVTVPFTAAGVYTPGNVYTAQLSDANGSFASPVAIGTLTSSASGAGTISATIPASGITGGSGYRIRVVSSTPAINGSDNGTNLTIVAIQTLPYAQDFASLTGSTTTFPAGWMGTLVSANPPSSGGRTTDAIGYKTLVGGDAASTLNGIYDYNGKLGFLNTKTADNAITFSFSSLTYSGGIGVTFNAMTIRNPYVGSPLADSVIDGLVLQYRVGSSGSFTTISYQAAEYSNNTTLQVSGTTPQKPVNGLFATLPAACDNQPLVQLRWIARTISGSTISTTTSQMPSFAIDNIYVGISTRAVGAANYSKGDTVKVAFNAAGVYTPGNVFTVQLSNATGSFASPTAIGSVTSNASGVQTITATIPAGQGTGSGYVIRVVSSTPSIIGTETGITVTISSAYYYKGTGSFSDVNSWGTNADGTGTAPADFITNYQLFKIVNAASITTATAGVFTVTGTGSRIAVGDIGKPGVTLTIASGAAITATGGLDMPQSNDAVANKVIIQNTTSPGFGTMYPNSEVHYQANIITGTTKSFGKMVIENNNTVTFSGTPTIQTALTLDAGSTMNTTNSGTFCKMNILPGATITINGTINVQNTAGLSCVSCDNAAGAVFNFAAATPSLTLGTNSTIQYAKVSASVQSVQPYNYANLDIIGSAGNPKTIQATGGSGNTAAVSGALTVTGATLNTGNILTLRSTASNTARVGVSTGTISGNVTVERYVAASRSWRLLTAPIIPSSTQTLNQAWQDTSARSITGVQNPDNHSGYGTHITGPAPSAINGFDQSPQNNYSIKYYDGTNWVGTGIQPLTTAITSQPGWMLFVRGDRSYAIGSTTSGTTPAATTLRTTGGVYSGTSTMPVITPAGFTVVGNPYASAVNFSNVTKSGPGDIYYIWDPKYGAFGGWITLTRSAGTTYTPSPVPVSNIDISTGRIESGAAFVVNAANITSLQFKEADKSSLNALVFRPNTGGAKQPSLRTNLYLMNSNGSRVLFDGALQLFDKVYHTEVDGADALKLTNFSENFGIAVTDKILAIEKRDFFSKEDTVNYNMSKLNVRNYRLEWVAEELNHGNLAGFIEDNYTHTSTPLNMNGSTTVDFAPLAAEPGSYAKDRFRLVFKKAVKYAGIKAMLHNTDVAVDWQIEEEEDMLQYDIERSSDGISFVAIGTQLSHNTGFAETAYNWLDPTPGPGRYFYRIKAMNKFGVTGYSDTATVLLVKGGPGIHLYPNPITGNTMHLQFEGMKAGQYAVQLLNALSQPLLNNEVDHAGGNAVIDIRLGKSIKKGNYMMRIIHPDKSISVQRAVVLE